MTTNIVSIHAPVKGATQTAYSKQLATYKFQSTLP